MNKDYGDILDEELLEDSLEDFSGNPEDSDEEQSGDMFEHYRFVLDKGQAPMRVDKYLATHMEYFFRHRI